MPLAVALAGLVLPLLLIMDVRLHAFITFILVSIAIGIGQGMASGKIVTSIEASPGEKLDWIVVIYYI